MSFLTLIHSLHGMTWHVRGVFQGVICNVFAKDAVSRSQMVNIVLIVHISWVCKLYLILQSWRDIIFST